MEKYIGVWLDHKKAVIISIIGHDESKHIIQSHVQTHRRIPGEGKQYTRMGNAYIAPEHRQEEKLKHQLNKYYEQIITYVRDATDLFIFGPGTAKKELEKLLFSSHKSLAGKVRQTEAADRLTENQIAAKVREFTAKMRSFYHPLAHPYTP